MNGTIEMFRKRMSETDNALSDSDFVATAAVAAVAAVVDLGEAQRQHSADLHLPSAAAEAAGQT